MEGGVPERLGDRLSQKEGMTTVEPSELVARPVEPGGVKPWKDLPLEFELKGDDLVLELGACGEVFWPEKPVKGEEKLLDGVADEAVPECEVRRSEREPVLGRSKLQFSLE